MPESSRRRTAAQDGDELFLLLRAGRRSRAAGLGECAASYRQSLSGIPVLSSALLLACPTDNGTHPAPRANQEPAERACRDCSRSCSLRGFQDAMSGGDCADDALVASVSDLSAALCNNDNGVNQLLVPFNSRSPLRSSLIKSGTRARSPARKTVSFSSLSSEKKVSNVADCLAHMQTGADLIKVRPNVRQFRRHFSLDADYSHLRWTPTNKKPHKARIAVDSIKEIRVGRNTEVLRASEACLNDMQEECAFSIIHGDEYECLDLVANSADEANIWVTGLMSLSSGNRSECRPSGSGDAATGMATLRERWLAETFDRTDTEQKGYLSEKSAVKLVRQLNSRLIVNRIKNRVKEVTAAKADEQRGRITRDEFVDVYKDVATRPEVYFLMVRYANKDYLTCEDMQLFLETEQGMMGVTKELCQAIIEQYEPSAEGKANHFMTVDGFTNYLLCDECSLFDAAHRSVCHDMDRPFNEYFIAASNNTYLVEDQMKGPSSVDGYVSALKRDCRFVELDLWEPAEDGSEGDEPVIYHGRTLTSRLPLTKALVAISEFAFERSQYPLLVRLEVHMGTPWQKILAHRLRTTLGSRLFVPANDPTDWTTDDNHPTPESFRNKILLVGKRLPKGDMNEGEATEEDESAEAQRRATKRSVDRHMPLCKELSDLICPFLQSTQLKDLQTVNESLSARKHLCSLNESHCLRIAHAYPTEFSAVTKQFLTRVYPNGVRVDSSNMNPQEFWNFGVQIVALNYQTPGLMMDLQEGKFMANGGCGYVLKPPLMREEVFTPGDKMPISVTPQILHLRILSGQQLPRPRGSTAKGDSTDPFVVVEVFGVPMDCAEERTKTVKNDSFNPSFDESFQFQISVPELAIIRFLVLDDDFIGDDFIGQYSIPFECLQSGYRHITLLNNEGDPLENCTLFVHIAVTNRRGGGKAKKRGMSVKRKTERVHTGIKMTGLKSIDELFKLAVIPLAECIEMRNQLEAATIEWQQQCGLGPAGTMRQGLRLLHTRVLTAAMNTTPPSLSPNAEEPPEKIDASLLPPNFEVVMDENGHPSIEMQGNMPDQLRKTFFSLDTLVTRCRTILTRHDQLLQKLEEATKRISDSYEELSTLCTDAGLRGHKATRASENFAWNLRLLKAQLELMNKTHEEARGAMQQICDTGCILGVLREKCTEPCPHQNSDDCVFGRSAEAPPRPTSAARQPRRSIVVVDPRSSWPTQSGSHSTRAPPVTDSVALSTLSERRRLRMSFRRARSVERSESGSYLSRWSRANTPVDSAVQYSQNVQRSFTPVREIRRRSSVQSESYDRHYDRSSTPQRTLTPMGQYTTPYRSNVNYYQEQQPLRKYDVFQLRTWSYPIWKYLHGSSSDRSSARTTRLYANQSTYTPPTMAAESRSFPGQRGYSGYTYMAGEHSFNVAARPHSLNSYQFWRSRVASSPWYWNYYGHSGLRHFSSYRPRTYQSSVRTYWNRY
uniref:Phosphoinositide phospholipase C n=2 Tax=Plectus sambesii TaxID=2011161 RepID=A0A914W8E7_9BILA